MRVVLLCALASISQTLLIIAADPPKPPAKLLLAQAQYEKVQAKLKADAEDASKIAANDYKKKLTAILEEETKAGNLDAAILVREEIKSVESGLPSVSLMTAQKVKTAADLAKFLVGTRWGDLSDPVIFQNGGLLRYKSWEDRGLVTTWRAIDRRTVVFNILKGRDTDLISVVVFNEPIEEFNGISFHKLEPWKMRKLPPEKSK